MTDPVVAPVEATAVELKPALPHPALGVVAEIEAKLASLEGVWAKDLRALVSKLKAHL